MGIVESPKSRFSNRRFSSAGATGAAVGVAAAVVPGIAMADLIIVDPADSQTVTFTHLGSDTWDLQISGKGIFSQFGQSGPGDGRIGFDFGFQFYTQGLDVAVPFVATSGAYSDGGAFLGGATSGVNYARLNLDSGANSAFETVVEFSFDTIHTGFSGDFITRYIYDNTGADLNIAAAVAGFSSGGGPAAVPEPSSLLTLVMFFVLGMNRFRRKRSLVGNTA